MKEGVFKGGLEIPIKIKQVTNAAEADSEDIVIEGFASTITKDRVGDIILPKAFEEAISNYLETPVLLYMHDKHKPIGAVTEIEMMDTGTKVKGYITTAVKFVRDEIKPLIDKGILNSFSVGFIPKDGYYDPDSDTYFITKGDLLEISVVSIPANPTAKFSVKKSFEENPEFEALRKSWKEKVNKNTDINKEKKEMEKLQELEKKLQDALAKISEQEEAIKEKEAALADLTEKIKKADEFVTKQIEQEELEKQKAAQEAAEKEKAELTKQLDNMNAAVEELKKAMEEQAKELAEAKAIAEKGSRRIEFTDPPADAIWKDFGETLDGLFIVHDMTNKSVNELLESKFYKDLPEQVKAVTLDAAFRTMSSRRIWEDIRANATIASLFESIELPTDVYNLPFDGSNITAEWVTAGNTSTDQSLVINPVQFQAKKMMAKVRYNYEDEADALVPVVSQIRKRLIEAIADQLDQTIMQSDGSTGNYANAFRGLESYATGAAFTSAAAAATDLAASDLYNAMIKMGKYAFKREGAVILTNFLKYAELVDDTNVLTVDKFGPNATLLTGELAKVHGKPIVVSDFVPGDDTATTGKAAMVVFTPAWLLGYRSNVRIETDKDIENQQKVIVFSLRVDFKSIFPLSAGELPASYPVVYQVTNP